jgi:ABC-type oligopeptide transport system substrate-binding subunit
MNKKLLALVAAVMMTAFVGLAGCAPQTEEPTVDETVVDETVVTEEVTTTTTTDEEVMEVEAPAAE